MPVLIAARSLFLLNASLVTLLGGKTVAHPNLKLISFIRDSVALLRSAPSLFDITLVIGPVSSGIECHAVDLAAISM